MGVAIPAPPRRTRRLWVLLAAALTALAACTGSGAPDRDDATAPPTLPPLGGERTGGVVAVVERVLPAVVTVTTDQLEIDPFGDTRPGEGIGTGFIVGSDGFIVTNYHVVENAQRIRVTTSGDDPQVHDARVVGGDLMADVAVLKIDAEGLPTLRMGSSSRLRLGQQVVAIGYALALEGGPTVTTGIVSSLDRVVEIQDPGCPDCDPPGVRRYSQVVQTDAAINPGNSGGPLVDMRGRVVGINTAGVRAGAAENIGFAIAIDAARPIVQEAMARPEAPVAFLGVTSRPVDEVLALQLGLAVTTGAFVVDVAPGGPAAEAGIRGGDVIVGFDGKPVPGSEQLGVLIRSREPGDVVQVEVVRADGSREEFTVALGVNPLP